VRPDTSSKSRRLRDRGRGATSVVNMRESPTQKWPVLARQITRILEQF
jgi:hypothetical protein